MYDLRLAMEAADSSLPTMSNLSMNDENAESLFSDNISSELDYDKIDSFFVSYASEGGKADEITVIAVKDMNDIEEAKQALEDHRESRRKLLEQYEPAEVKRIEDGIIFTKEQYAVLIISDNSSAVRKAFEEFIKK
jgi:Uma2 family endonuclease